MQNILHQIVRVGNIAHHHSDQIFESKNLCLI